MNKKMKTLLSILLIALVVVSITTSVFAITPGEVKPDASGNTTKIESTGKQIIGIIQTIGIILSVGVLMVIGVKYMMGSAQEKAEYKKVFIPYIIGAALLFAASVFAQAIYDFFNGMNSAPEETKKSLEVIKNVFLG